LTTKQYYKKVKLPKNTKVIIIIIVIILIVIIGKIIFLDQIG